MSENMGRSVRTTRHVLSWLSLPSPQPTSLHLALPTLQCPAPSCAILNTVRLNSTLHPMLHPNNPSPYTQLPYPSLPYAESTLPSAPYPTPVPPHSYLARYALPYSTPSPSLPYPSCPTLAYSTYTTLIDSSQLYLPATQPILSYVLACPSLCAMLNYHLAITV